MILFDFVLSEWHTGHITVIHRPTDAIAVREEGALFNCTVDGMSHQESLIWWRSVPGEGLKKIFESSSSSQSNPVYLNTNKYEIRGYYNLYIKSVEIGDAGEYLCEVTGHDPYSAHLTVVGKIQAIISLIITT